MKIINQLNVTKDCYQGLCLRALETENGNESLFDQLFQLESSVVRKS